MVLLGETWITLAPGEPSSTIQFAVEGNYGYYIELLDVFYDYVYARVKAKIRLFKMNNDTGEIVDEAIAEVEPGQSVTFHNYVIEVPKILAL